MRKHVNRAPNDGRPAVQDMGVDHRRFHVLVGQEFLDGSDVIAGFEQMGGEEPRNVWQAARLVRAALAWLNPRLVAPTLSCASRNADTPVGG